MSSTKSSPARPVLIYDGDCGFCKYWARYWERLTGTAVRYTPYQHVATDYPQMQESVRRRTSVDLDGELTENFVFGLDALLDGLQARVKK